MKILWSLVVDRELILVHTRQLEIGCKRLKSFLRVVLALPY